MGVRHNWHSMYLDYKSSMGQKVEYSYESYGTEARVTVETAWYRSWGCRLTTRKAWRSAIDRDQTKEGRGERAEGEARHPCLSFSPLVSVRALLCRLKPRIGVRWPCSHLCHSPVSCWVEPPQTGKMVGWLKELPGAHGTCQLDGKPARREWVTLISDTGLPWRCS